MMILEELEFIFESFLKNEDGGGEGYPSRPKIKRGRGWDVDLVV